jgi:two-component system response regulator AtoC
MLAANGGPRTIVLAQDDLDSRSYLETALIAQGYRVCVAEDGDEVLRCIEQEGTASLLLMDIAMPRLGALQFLQEVRKRQSQLPVILYSGETENAELDRAIERGWARFLEKPVHHKRLIHEIESLISEGPAAPPVNEQPWRGLLENPYMRQMDSMLRQVGMADIPILLQGETGVGKEVMARQIHAYSRRAGQAFVKVNCAALPSELVESELFGYQRGAFTGAVKDRPGLFERAEGGTILLDEIGDMDFRLQAKLLQVLQDSEFHRLGSGELVRVNARVMAATHQDLQTAIQERRFREDLFYRLNVVNIRIPALRERRGEIPTLAHSLLKKHCAAGQTVPVLTPSLQRVMMQYHWPGNIRELENLMRRYLVMRDSGSLVQELQRLCQSSGQMAGDHEDVPASVPVSVLQEAERAKCEAERAALLKALESTRWSRKQAAALLHIDYKAFLYKMKKLGIGNTPQSSS